MHRFDYLEPATLSEAVALLAQHGARARVLAGGTDLLTALKEGWERPDWVLSIGRVADLRYIRYDSRDGLRIGALATVREVETSPLVRKHYPVLAEAAGTLASVQIRNLATLAGNVCRASPSGDTLPALLVLDAEARLVGPSGERRVPLARFFVGPGRTVMEPTELLAELVLPPPRPGTGAHYIKHSLRRAMDLAVVGVAALVALDGETCVDARIALGAVAPTPIRALAAEEQLVGRPITPDAAEAAADLAQAAARPITDVRGTAPYRRRMVHVLTRRCILRAAELAQSQGRLP
ncbi:MAG: xanthine dehydrogenase family protein subunit M [Caldilineales bacterium]|nr:xanthine dehydrogenase family protein subunit M [Caldilineales bacterium]MDW8318031.1 xanthine dehydrogenase family protein subunit M [Anaerolineae bacterium]